MTPQGSQGVSTRLFGLGFGEDVGLRGPDIVNLLPRQALGFGLHLPVFRDTNHVLNTS